MLNSEPIRFIDLFAGMGGTRIGFEQACEQLGLKSECVFTSEKKKSAITVYSDNFDDDHGISGDITEVPLEDIPAFDFLLGGFPCQPFSLAGKRRGFSDTRGTLFFNIEEILRTHRPIGFILENVPGLITHSGGETLSIIIDHLQDLGYKTSYRVIKSEDVGVPQKRDRVYIAGHKSFCPDLSKIGVPAVKKTFKDVQEHGKPVFDTPYTRALLNCFKASDLIGKQIIDKRFGNNVIHSWDFGMNGAVSERQKNLLVAISKNHRRRDFAVSLGLKFRDGMPLNADQIRTFVDYPELESDLEYLSECGYLIKKHPYKDDCLEERTDLPIGYRVLTGRLAFNLNRFLHPDDLCVTLTATDASHIGVVDGNGIRSLTKREMLRLLGFPESYSLEAVSEADAYDLCGNSICVPVVKEVALKFFH